MKNEGSSVFNFVFKAMGIFIAFVFVVIIAAWILIGTLAVKATKAIQNDGLKGVSSQIWNGSTTNK